MLEALHLIGRQLVHHDGSDQAAVEEIQAWGFYEIPTADNVRPGPLDESRAKSMQLGRLRRREEIVEALRFGGDNRRLRQPGRQRRGDH